MNNSTRCHIIRYSEWAHQAMVEAEEHSRGTFGHITILTSEESEDKRLPSFDTTVGFAIELRQRLFDSCKTYDFKIAVARARDGIGLRILEDSEWIPAAKRRKSLRRSVRAQTKKKPTLPGRVSRASKM